MRAPTRAALNIRAAVLSAGCGALQPAQDDAQLQISAPSAASPANGYYLHAIAPKNSELHIYPLAGMHQREIGHIDDLPAAHGIGTDHAGNL
jgi:hypothetical protein